ncbi:hypothetical protein PXH81_03435 [Xylella fastidiosa]|uniref:hypothetical protein n=1 Tax=Xylella fastidiosa TaxID=2371 RepID=UPI00052D9E53|nr:hypothetical protein [Xylella fastidiosa]KGM20627.1 hypothetical protein JT24_06140 [Xylella fastidiosa]QIS25944.1 hypothetical protein F7G16_06975 [Xylella fastidiosa]RWA34379.1 hypothetical protein XfCFBP7970_11340 [Xylella fastidiosa subsp. fastidiosa]WDF00134.1 hypothetical protein PUO95_08090 [Xylella fastidiosa subsp. fastidiosa]WDV82016.1 hypothetical protein PXH81_06055 [Xylella fastidiosa]
MTFQHTCPTFPAKINAGCSLQISLTLKNYPWPDWTLHCLLRGPASLDLTAQGENTTHRFDIPAADTAQWTPGDYLYQLRAAHSPQTIEIKRGKLRVEPDFASLPQGYDGRSDNQRALDAINAVLQKRATQDQQRYRINNRELWRTTIAELLKLRTFYAVAVQRETPTDTPRSWGNIVPVRFVG